MVLYRCYDGCKTEAVLENKVVWADKKVLQEEIEQVRRQLNKAMEEMTDFEACYQLSVSLDKLIERYIDVHEKEWN